MNQGKICVSICAATIPDLIDRAAEADESGDLIELRFDCLENEELGAGDVNKLRSNLTRILDRVDRSRCITTFRPQEYGGCRELSERERSTFWNVGCETEYADLEPDVVEDSWSGLWGERICSFHDFDAVPASIDSTFHKLADLETGLVKIAVHVDDATNAIPVWNLFPKARERGARLIPIAMGEAGKWTRILGLAHGAPITYASLDRGDETAPGQISARDLHDVFRVRELDLSTAVYGVIAGDTSYSLSPYMHNAAFKRAGMNSVFIPLQVRDLDAFMQRMVKPATREVDLNFHGFSVTNPHKLAIMKHLDSVDDTARAIGAVNTVKIEDGKLLGFNTDAEGFISPLRSIIGDLADARVTVAGAGGAARACVYALKREGAEVTVVARDATRAAAFAEEFVVTSAPLGAGCELTDTDILINATPIGTRGDRAGEAVATADELKGVKLVYDLVYNPEETELLRRATIAGAKTLGGMDMLVAQGARQFLLWTGIDAPIDEMKAALNRRLKETYAS